MPDYELVILDQGTVTVSQVEVPVSVDVGVESTVQILTIGQQGPMGPQGPQGIMGPTGTSYIHSQAIPLDTWVITHNLARFPSVTVVDSAGTHVMGDVDYTDSNTVTLTFVGAFAGVCYLN